MGSDWQTVRLGDYTNVQTGPFGSQLHKKDYADIGTPIITVEHLGDNRIIHSNLPRVSEKDRLRLRKYWMRRGDIIFSRVGSVDRSAYVHKEEDAWLFSGRCLRVRVNDSNLDSRFLSFYFGLESVKEHIRQIAVGATMPSLNTALLSNIKVIVPPLSDQRAIAHILGSLDDKIELNRRMNQTLEATARAIFKSCFLDFDPVRAKAEGGPTGLLDDIAVLFPDSFEDSELGGIPRGWEVGVVSDLGSVICGKTPPTKDPENYGEDIPFITIPDMHGKVFVTQTGKYLSTKGANTQRNKYLPAKSICVSCIATPGLVVMTTEQSQTNQQINSVIPNNGESSYYCFQVLNRLGDQIRTGGSGDSVLLNLNKTLFSNIKVLIPNHNITEGYQKTVEPLFEKLLQNQRESASLSSLRDTLLPKLISGELRVPDAEKFAQETGV